MRVSMAPVHQITKSQSAPTNHSSSYQKRPLSLRIASTRSLVDTTPLHLIKQSFSPFGLVGSSQNGILSVLSISNTLPASVSSSTTPPESKTQWMPIAAISLIARSWLMVMLLVLVSGGEPTNRPCHAKSIPTKSRNGAASYMSVIGRGEHHTSRPGSPAYSPIRYFLASSPAGRSRIRPHLPLASSCTRRSGTQPSGSVIAAA